MQLFSEGFGVGVEEVDALVVGVDGDAFVLAMGADVFMFEGDGGEAVAGDAFGGEEDAVAGAGFHFRDDGDAGPELVHQFAHGDEDFIEWRRGRDGLVCGVAAGDDSGEDGLDFEGGVSEEGDELPADFFGGVAGEDAAVDVGLRELGQGVVGVAAGEARGDAGGVKHGVPGGVGGETVGCRQIG